MGKIYIPTIIEKKCHSSQDENLPASVIVFSLLFYYERMGFAPQNVMASVSSSCRSRGLFQPKEGYSLYLAYYLLLPKGQIMC